MVRLMYSMNKARLCLESSGTLLVLIYIPSTTVWYTRSNPISLGLVFCVRGFFSTRLEDMPVEVCNQH